MGSRSRWLIQQSRELIEASRETVARVRRRALLSIRGGSTSVAESSIDIPPIFAFSIVPAWLYGRTRCAAGSSTNEDATASFPVCAPPPT